MKIALIVIGAIAAACILLEVFGRIVAKRARARFGKLSREEQRRFQESAYKANQ